MNQQQRIPWPAYATQGSGSLDLTHNQSSVPMTPTHQSPSQAFLPRSALEQPRSDLQPYLPSMARDANAEALLLAQAPV